ncbi:LacI family DNA-binding transcriptional regulator [Compostimonas suwonensis]|uniref:DNA-binding LacI/PurR family transcriptional regulator n=1 Tax=Compostimonas suwonensis TaxID=1048394 RepID=A0A2M9BZ96_9MICO|nr:LacI family DNA-binding transcriptional regulator [Compostimonas suwonensis]PJJ63407.1 DNA-binding LacI/PurR family transcriptional regulator [Compostimonas suwonensis]
MSRRLAEVARKVGVSEATVSRVLNEKPGVSESTREAVLTALDVLGYERPTKLRGERARLVGLFLPELQNPIFPAFGEVIGGGLAQNGYTPVLCTQSAGGISEADYIELLLQQRVSGVVFVGGVYTQEDSSHDHYARLTDLKMPTVLVSAPVSGLDFATVSCDDSVAMELALSHLRQLGHSRIGLLLGPRDHVPSQRKLAAAIAFAERDRLSFDDDRVVHSLYSLEAGQAAATRLLQAGVTAIVCASDPMALGAIRAVRRAGLRVPHDVSVIGYDDSALMTCVEPPLTTVRQPIDPMGRMVIELLVQQISGDSATSDEFFFEPELVVRGSTGPASDR